MSQTHYIRFLKTALVILFFSLSFVSSVQATKLKSKQIEYLQLVKEIAKKYPNRKGETFEQTAMAILLTETNAGTTRIGDLGKKPNIYRASLGLMQVRLQTARFIGKKLKIKAINNLSDGQLVSKLLIDDSFNVMVAVRYLVWLSNRTKDYFTTVSRYNGGNVNYPYYGKVMRSMKRIKKVPNLF